VASPKLPELTVRQVRQLALDAQSLGAAPSVAPAAVPDSVVRLIRRLGYVQRDPLNVVALSHELVLWSRLGELDRGAVEVALWKDRELFEYWAHAAAILPSEDFPLHLWRMRHFRRSPPSYGAGMAEWIASNQQLRRRLLRRLAAAGPLPAGEIGLTSRLPRDGSGWPGLTDQQRMLEVLWFQGLVGIAGRDGRGRLWDLIERTLPMAATAPAVPRAQAMLQLAHRSLQAQAVATPRQIARHLNGGAPSGLELLAAQLVRRGQAHEVAVRGPDGLIPGPWLISPFALESWKSGALERWQGRTTLLSPFDNLIIDRRRTELIFEFRYRMEIYVPPDRRQFGYYVLPILCGDRLVGRLDCRRNLADGRLEVLSVHREPGDRAPAGMATAIRAALVSLARAARLESIAFRDPELVAAQWREGLLD
jgi:uncharacterized protein YcaQ